MVPARPMMKAAMDGHTDTVALLVDRGGDVNAAALSDGWTVYSDGWTAVMWASKGGHTDTVAVLVEKGADVNAAASDGTTAVLVAARSGVQDTVAVLVEKGADVNAKDSDGKTPVMDSATYGLTDTVALLVDQRADVNAADSNGMTAVMQAAYGGHKDTVALLVDKAQTSMLQQFRHVDTCDACCGGRAHGDGGGLVDKGADVNAANNTGTTAVIAAAQGRHKDTVALLWTRRRRQCSPTFWHDSYDARGGGRTDTRQCWWAMAETLMPKRMPKRVKADSCDVCRMWRAHGHGGISCGQWSRRQCSRQ